MVRTAQPDVALATAIRKLREERGLTREAVAFHAGITNGALARIELAQSAPKWFTIRLILSAMSVSLVALAARVEELE